MTLAVVKGIHTSGNPPIGNNLASSVGIGQVILAFATGGGLPGTATVSDNVNTGNYNVLAQFTAQNMMIYWMITNASGTPTVAMASAGGFTDLWAMGVTGFVGTPTSDAGAQGEAHDSTGTSTTPTLSVTDGFANEILLMAFGTAYTQSVAASGWSNGTTGSNSGFNALYSLQPSPASVPFNGTIVAAQNWALQSAGIYDAGGGATVPAPMYYRKNVLYFI